MKILTTCAALATAAALGAPSSAFAQQTFGGTLFNVSDIGAPYAGSYGALPPYEVITIVRSMGFNPQSRPVLRGRVYILHAVDDQGILVRVAVDASSGRVVRVIERAPGAAYGALPPDRYGAYPVPPSAVPGAGPAYEESEDAPRDYRPDYRTPDYRAPDNRAPGNNAYPRPIYPQSSTQPPAAEQRPRVAARTPPASSQPPSRPRPAPVTNDAKATQPAAAPQVASTPAANPPAATAPAASAPAVNAPAANAQGAATTAPAPATTAAIADSGRPGKSVPAPVARKVEPPQDTTAAKPATPAPSETAKPADPALVPVAPLE